MANIVLNDNTLTVGAQMTRQEYAVVKVALEQPGGKEGLQQMFASFLQQQRAVQIEAEKAAIHAFIDHATDEQRAGLMAVVKA